MKGWSAVRVTFDDMDFIDQVVKEAKDENGIQRFKTKSQVVHYSLALLKVNLALKKLED